mgnify:CR=1 FL=1
MKNCSEAKKETPHPRGWVSAAVAAVTVALLVALLIMVLSPLCWLAECFCCVCS